MCLIARLGRMRDIGLIVQGSQVVLGNWLSLGSQQGNSFPIRSVFKPPRISSRGEI
jgi:hypothetical protein